MRSAESLPCDTTERLLLSSLKCETGSDGFQFMTPLDLTMCTLAKAGPMRAVGIPTKRPALEKLTCMHRGQGCSVCKTSFDAHIGRVQL